MGMSASQARLLSITARLTNNEFRAQTITDRKLRLAEQSSDASKEYMDALNSQKLVFGIYNSNGEKAYTNLTAGLLNTFEPLKNQYVLKNYAGKSLVSAIDAKNYEETNSLAEFLQRYGLVDEFSVTEKMEVNNPDYKAEWDNYKDLYDEWVQSEPNRSDYEDTKVSESSQLYDDYINMIKSSACYSITVNSGKRCYMHLLNDLIGIGQHTTSDGNTFEVKPSGSGWNWNVSEYSSTSQTSLNINKKIKEKMAKEDGPFAGKTVYQAIVDFIYANKDKYIASGETSTGGVATDEEINTFWYIVNTELKEATTELVFDEDGYNRDYEAWKAKEPAVPTVSPTITKDVVTEYITLNDKDKAQWYTNLWYLMNGSETANAVKKEKDVSDDSGNIRTVYTVSGTTKSFDGGNYAVLEDNLLNSTEWLKFALENGVVQMLQAQYYNLSVDSGKVPEITSEGFSWQSIIYTNAPDIISQDDDAAIAVAEAKYKTRMDEIENQDTKYDQDLKKLDTEHSALQTEYESIKEVISKNVERTFKAFS